MVQVLRNPDRSSPCARRAPVPGPIYRPDADILERADEYVVLRRRPGRRRAVGAGALRQGRAHDRGAARRCAPEPAWTPRHVEYQPGGYAREFRIADGIEVESIRASLKHGVLELHLPKTGRRRAPDDPGGGRVTASPRGETPG